MRVVMIGDVGVVDSYHVGDEAMLEAAVDELRARADPQITVLSANPVETAGRYGVDSVGVIGFGWEATPGDAERDERLRRVVGAAEGDSSLLELDDPAWDVIDEVSASTAVLIAGGGNLTTPFADHLYERVALGAIAAALGKPLVVSGQSLGPHLSPRHTELLGGLLRSARLVGVRETHSAGTAVELGVSADRLHRVADDATFLGFGETTDVIERLGLTAGGYAVVSFPDYAGAADPEVFATSLVAMTTRLQEYTGLTALMIPHHGTFGEDTRSHDDHMAERLRAVPGLLVAPLLPAREVAELTRGAALSVSGRYHPIVFALAGSVPSIGVWVDLYTRRKITGVLDNVGLADWAVPSTAVGTDDFDTLVRQTWDRRDEIAAHLDAVFATRTGVFAEWWDAVAVVAAGAGDDPAPVTPDGTEVRLQLSDPLASSLATLASNTASQLQSEFDLANPTTSGTLRAAASTEMETRVTSSSKPVPLADDYAAQIEILEQALFERERYAASLARALSEAEAVADRRVAEQHRVIADLKNSTSWKLSLPVRVLRHPARYLRIALGR